MTRWLNWSQDWRDVVERLAHPGTPPADEDSFEDSLGDSLRWSLRDAVGRAQPPQTVWTRIERELRQPAHPPRDTAPAGLERLKLGLQGIHFDPGRLMQGATTLAVLALLVMATIERAPGWWGLPGIRSTPVAVDELPAQRRGPEAINRLYRVRHAHDARVPESGQVAWRAEERDDSAVSGQLARVQDAFGVFVEAGESLELDATRLVTPALIRFLASSPRDIPPRGGLLRQSQPVVFVNPQGAGVIR